MTPSRTFITFLGTSSYTEVNYLFNNHACQTHFVSHAILQAIAKDWTKEDQALFFITSEAHKQNWAPESQDPSYPGLQEILTSAGYPFTFKSIEINTGLSEAEIWHIFHTIYNAIPEKSELYIDITNAFRSIPMLCMVLIPYAKATKQIIVRGIYYGAFEVLGPPRDIENNYPDVKDRKVPILDLTLFSDLQELSYGVRSFLETGKADLIVHSIEQSIKNSSPDKQPALIKIKNLFYEAKKLHDGIATCRGKVLVKNYTGKKLHHNIQSLLNSDVDTTTFLASISPLFKQVQRKIQTLPAEQHRVSALWYAIDYAIEHGMTQQGLTLLREGLAAALLEDLCTNRIYTVLDDVNARALKEILQRINDHYTKNGKHNSTTKLKVDLHKTLTTIFTHILPNNKEDDPDNWKLPKDHKDHQDHRKLLIFMLQHHPFVLEMRSPEYKKNLHTLIQLRNDINHAGFIEGSMKAQKFHDKLNNLWDAFKPLLLKYYR